jgi:membrane protease YdiL (CAAX protease family)
LNLKSKIGGMKKAWLVVEILFLYAIILTFIWIIFPLENFFFNLAAVLFILGAVTFSSVHHRKSLKDIGMLLDNFYDSLKLVGSFTFILILAMLVAGFLVKSIHFAFRFIPDLLFYLVWAFLQQYTFQTFFNLRFSEIFNGRIYGVICTALLFSSVHYPNPALMPATLILGLFWFWFFLKQPNLFTLTLSHALLASLARYALPLAVSDNLRVGTLYLFSR